jgi:DNA modification methylase
LRSAGQEAVEPPLGLRVAQFQPFRAKEGSRGQEDDGCCRCGCRNDSSQPGASDMVRGKSRQELQRVGKTALAPFSDEEHALIGKVNGSPVSWVPIDCLKQNPRHARLHSESKITALAGSIRRSRVIEPLLVQPDHTIISGHARAEALRRLRITEAPVRVLAHLADAEVRALAIALNRFPEWGTWDREQLRIELPEIIAELPDLAMEEIGFSVQEADRFLAPDKGEGGKDPADDLPPISDAQPTVSRSGDLWRLGQNLLLCGNALETACYDRLLGSKAVRLVLTDPPYNVRINGNVTKRIGRFAEFAMGAGELTNEQFRAFLHTAFKAIARASTAGAIGLFFIDWRHVRVMQEAADGVFHELKNHIVWVKDSFGLGSFYRSQHESVLAYKIAAGQHVNNFELGQHGRTRTNVWQYAGMNSGGAGRDEALAMHATPKPVAMLVDAILDCSNPGDLVLDPFGGSGSTLIAAERSHRRARVMEIDPVYVDTTIRRWEQWTGEEAVLDGTNQSFAVVARARTIDEERKTND